MFIPSYNRVTFQRRHESGLMVVSIYGYDRKCMQGAALLCKILDLIPDEALHVNSFFLYIYNVVNVTHDPCVL